MTNNAEYWIWLQRAVGAGFSARNVISFYGTPEHLYESGRKSWEESGLFNNKMLDLLSAYSPSQSESVVKDCKNNGWHIITCDDEQYPKRLLELKNYPLVLYVDGDVSELNMPFSIGIVGTRDASKYGKDVATRMAYALASAGCGIISGGALGVDSCAHEGAIAASGKTIAFLGSGLGCNYLKSNENLRFKITQNGALVSEYFPFTLPSKISFPIRNRLISGFCNGLLVVEAGVSSGSLITAKFAMEQGRDVFAVPGSILSNDNSGTNNLIRNGAKAVFTPMDILDGYTAKYGKYIKPENMHKMPVKNNTVKQAEIKSFPQKKQTEAKPKVSDTPPVQEAKSQDIPDYASEDASKLFAVMSQSPQTADEYTELCGMPIHRVLSALTELEMYDVIKAHTGKRYSKN